VYVIFFSHSVSYTHCLYTVVRFVGSSTYMIVRLFAGE
jgi:hypothetical protein